MQAINPKYTKKIQRLYKLDRQYSDLIDAHARSGTLRMRTATTDTDCAVSRNVQSPSYSTEWTQ